MHMLGFIFLKSVGFKNLREIATEFCRKIRGQIEMMSVRNKSTQTISSYQQERTYSYKQWRKSVTKRIDDNYLLSPRTLKEKNLRNTYIKEPLFGWSYCVK